VALRRGRGKGCKSDRIEAQREDYDVIKRGTL